PKWMQKTGRPCGLLSNSFCREDHREISRLDGAVTCSLVAIFFHDEFITGPAPATDAAAVAWSAPLVEGGDLLRLRIETHVDDGVCCKPALFFGIFGKVELREAFALKLVDRSRKIVGTLIARQDRKGMI